MNDQPAFTHVALCVADLRSAEALYADLFDMEVAFREAATPDGWPALPEPAGWDEAERAGIRLGLVMLVHGGLHIALEAVDEIDDGNRLSHIGMRVTPRSSPPRVSEPLLAAALSSPTARTSWLLMTRWASAGSSRLRRTTIHGRSATAPATDAGSR
jgi:catechol 2,3-dioxygenase-like lactoylglutathione lyase family enzyme